MADGQVAWLQRLPAHQGRPAPALRERHRVYGGVSSARARAADRGRDVRHRRVACARITRAHGVARMTVWARRRPWEKKATTCPRCPPKEPLGFSPKSAIV